MSDERAPERASAGSKLHRLAEALEPDHGTDATGELAKRLVRLSEQYEGPFAHPQVLKALDDVIANGAERAFSMAEREQSHRHAIDHKVLDAEMRETERMSTDRRILVIGGLVLVLSGLVLSFIAAVRGSYVFSGVAGAASLVAAIIAGFKLLGKRNPAP